MPRKIGRYRIEAPIGEGGMGVVLKGLDEQGRRAAIKVFTRSSARELARFEREARVHIEHPNVVRVMGSGTSETGVPYIAFELLEGEPFSAIFARGPLREREVIELGVQACRGLVAAHAGGIIHRDIKPSNLFRAVDGTIKVLDFGVAHFVSLDERLTATGSIVGTPAYLAPEQVRGTRDVGFAADVWSMGVVLYQAGSGISPFDRGSDVATLRAVITDDPMPLSIAAPETSAGLAAIIARALEKPAVSRWQDAGELLRALELLLQCDR